MPETLKGFPTRCRNCGKELSVSNLVHNETGGDSVMCSCEASTTPLFPGQATVKAPKEQIDTKPEPPMSTKKTTKKTKA
jgi:hypothetical protein